VILPVADGARERAWSADMIGLQDEHDRLAPPPPPAHAPRLAARIFAEDGVLADALKLEHRPQQEKMARAVAAALRDDEPLLFEAGTGVGKSLAYLLPGIIHAVDQSRQLVVSTHTIALQEQLEQADLPLCRRVLASDKALEPYTKFKSAVLVGKSNYLCTSRLAAALRDKHELFASPEHSELARIAAWAATSKEGLRHELSPPPAPEVWELVSADSAGCSRKHCDGEKCFYQRARARVRSAQVVVVNHSLLFTLLGAGAGGAAGSRGVLFADDFVVLDEAHTVPEVATEHFGLHLSSYGVERMLKHLHNPKTKRGVLAKFGDAADRLLAEDALEAARQFFAAVEERLLPKQAIVRVREAGVAEPWLDEPLGALHAALKKRADRFEDGRERDELQEQAGRVAACRAGLREWLTLADAGKQVYWAERGGRKQTIVTLRAAPIDVAPLLRENLFRRDTACVLTSATLTAGDDIEPFAARVGAADARAAVEASPFDFERNMRVFVATDVPLPTPQEARLALDVLADYIGFCTRRTAGGSLVLFTSYADMKAVAATLEPELAKSRRPFFMQGRDVSRTELAKQLRAAGNGVLFGTDSFWTGIDVPGDALAQVIVTRLPFEVPTHPVLEARAEHIRDNGGNPFNELTLPDALIKFRQGIGRLIRTARDRGVVTILDSRVTQKAYGRQFLGCLPVVAHTRMTRVDREKIFRPFV
jgi:ATP-dependent DNA helicase DinG